MAEPVVEPIGPHRNSLGELPDEIEKVSRSRSNISHPRALVKRWKSMIVNGTGFVLLDGSDCIGLLLYSAEYDLRFSSFLSASSAEKLPKSATIYACHVLKRARDRSGLHERLLLQAAVSRLRTIKSIETIAIQTTSLYKLDLRKTLKNLGFMSCRRVRMERDLAEPIPEQSFSSGYTIQAPTLRDADDLRSVVYHGYFSEIDGYLFPDIAAVCSHGSLFNEFLSSSSIDKTASVMARREGYPCGCVLVLSDEDLRLGLIGVVAVIPIMRRRGIARAMLLHVMHWLKEHQHDRAALAVTVENRPALRLYSSIGFRETAPRTEVSVWRRSVSRPRMKFAS